MIIELGLNNEQVRYLERLIYDSKRPYYERIAELGSFLHTKILLDEDRHAIKRLVNETTFLEYELMSKLRSYDELNVWYDKMTLAINELDSQFNANKAKLHHYSHESFVKGLVPDKDNVGSERKIQSPHGKRTSLLSLIGAFFKPSYRKTQYLL